MKKWIRIFMLVFALYVCLTSCDSEREPVKQDSEKEARYNIDPDGNREIYDATYDVEGNLIDGGYTVQDSDREIYRRAYYEGGKLIKDVYTDSVSDYTYDENGNIIRLNRSRTQEPDILVEYEYQFVYVGYDLPQEVEERVEDFRDNWNSFETWFGEGKG